MKETITPDFFLTDAVSLAQKLLGKILIRNIDGKIIKAIIVETEAYMGATDRACHGYDFRVSSKTLPLYKIGGTTYIYLTYVMYHIFNIVCSLANNPQSVLIRAVEVIDGHDFVKNNLKSNNRSKPQNQWTNGPGKLTIALKIDKSLNEIYLLNNHFLTLKSDNFIVVKKDIVCAKRINIDSAKEDKDHLWRFYLKNNHFVSKIIK